VRHYVADAPPPAVVTRVADAFAHSQGDLRATMIALVDSPEVWEQPFPKFKQPEQYAISILRAANLSELPQRAALRALVAMGQRAYGAAGPDGWSDSADSWLTGDLVWKRLEFAQTFSSRIARADVNPLAIADACQGPLLSDDTRTAVQRAESPEQGLAILFGAPEFQRR